MNKEDLTRLIRESRGDVERQARFVQEAAERLLEECRKVDDDGRKIGRPETVNYGLPGLLTGLTSRIDRVTYLRNELDKLDEDI